MSRTTERNELAHDSASRAAPRLVLTGRGIVPGRAEARALVTTQTISGWGGIDPSTGTVIEKQHELEGISFAGRILVFPGAKGSSGWSGFFQSSRLLGSPPAAMLFTTVTTKAVLGAVVTRCPTVIELDGDPVALIRTDDWVEVDGDRGRVSVFDPAPTGAGGGA